MKIDGYRYIYVIGNKWFDYFVLSFRLKSRLAELRSKVAGVQ